MSIEDVLEDIKFVETTFRNLIVTSNFKKISENEISWNNYQSGIFKNIYAKEFETVVKNRQYSFLLPNDKGCIQYYFLFQSKVLSKVKMAYYPYPVELREDLNEIESLVSDAEDEILSEYYFDIWNILNHQFELNINDENLKKIISESLAVGNDETAENLIMGKFEYKYKSTNSSHLRVDYDSKVTSHHKCEIQMGAINNIRLPMSKLVSPFIFFEFIIKNLFPLEFNKIFANKNYQSTFNNSKKKSINIIPFIETNIFLHQD